MGWEFPRFPQDGKFPKLGKFPKHGKFPGIPVQEIPGREKFEAIWEGGNGNFPLNIPGGSSCASSAGEVSLPSDKEVLIANSTKP